MAAAALTLGSCADDKFEQFQTAAPEHSVQYDYLNSYGSLKSYVNHSDYPVFRLGGAIDGADFNKHELVYSLAVNNFEEVVTGNTFKLGSVVNKKGIYDFTTVENFVKNATDAGLSVYGHTLCWHEQQQPDWLNTLIADRIPEGKGDGKDYIFKSDFEDGTPIGGWGNDHKRSVKSGSYDGSKYMEIETVKATNSWEAQGAVDFPSALEPGTNYTLHFWAKSSAPYTLTANFQNPQNYAGGGNFAPCELTTEWTEFTVEATVQGENIKRFLFNYGNFKGTICIDDMSIYTASAPTVKIPKQVVEYTFDDDVRIGGWGNGSTQGIVDGGYQGGKCWRVINPSSVNSWECQSAIDFANALEEGQTYFLHFWAKASKEGDVNAAYQNPSNYSGRGDYPNFHLTTEWKEYTLSTSITGDNCKRLCFNLGKQDGEIYFDNIEIYYEVEANGIPLTDEEKKDTLTWAMEGWIKGMMEACDGKVKAWDAVNEPIDGWGTADASGLLPLQHANAENPDATKFYWQDYLGDEEYVRTVIKLARLYGPEDIKLFINDYALEGYVVNGKYVYRPKLESLIKWIEKWESDGVTKIDGIGTQMHINCFEDDVENQKMMDGIVASFQKMAATDKFIRVSELDMGYIDAAGKAVMTDKMTEEGHKKMAELYKFVVSKYLEIIPKEQQWGVCAWGVTDQDPKSGWRPGEPTGLWDQNYYRKHTYAGFADGLKKATAQ